MFLLLAVPRFEAHNVELADERELRRKDVDHETVSDKESTIDRIISQMTVEDIGVLFSIAIPC